MKDLQVFYFQGRSVRIAFDESGKPLFCAKDVCDILGYLHRSAPVFSLKDEDRGELVTMTTGSGVRRDMQTIKISGLYELIHKRKRRRPDVKKILDWFDKDVFPELGTRT